MKRQKETEWARLENAAKFFPPTCGGRDTKVFRLSCELYEPVRPELLQRALERTMEDFPLFRSVLRRGMFWYYLESSDLTAVAEPESKPVCAPIYLGNRHNLLFRVIYFGRRISMEVFHSLSDGTGAAGFFQMMVMHYLAFSHPEHIPNVRSGPYLAAVGSQMDDSYQKYAAGDLFPRGRPPGQLRAVGRGACQIRGGRLSENRIRVIEGSMPAQAVLELARKHKTTLSVFLAALLICAIGKEMPARRGKRPIVLSVPINLRQFFESASARNFFCTMNVGCRPESGAPDLDTVVRTIEKEFQLNLTGHRLNLRLNQFMFLERNPLIRIIPLPLKNGIIRMASTLADRQITATISNIGRLSAPEEAHAFIRQFSVCVSAKIPRLALCSFGDRMVMSFSSPFRESNVERTFFRMLSEMGIEIEIASNL